MQLPQISPDGSRLLYFTEGDDSLMLNCIDMSTGARLWRRFLSGFIPQGVCRFIGSDTVLVAEGKHIEFLDASDGSLLKVIRVPGEGLQDLTHTRYQVTRGNTTTIYDTLNIHFAGRFLFLYFDDATQIIDLHRAERVFQGTESGRMVQYRWWDSTLMAAPASGADTFFLVDERTGSLLFRGSLRDHPLNRYIFQPYMIRDSTLLLVEEDSIVSIDMAAKRPSVGINFDPDRAENFKVMIFHGALCVLVSDDGIHRLFDARSGTLLWQVGELPGIVDQILELPNDEALLVRYDDRGGASILKIDTRTGNKVWTRTLFYTDRRMLTGHLTVDSYGGHDLAWVHQGQWQQGGPWALGHQIDRTPLRQGVADESARWAALRTNEAYAIWMASGKVAEGYVEFMAQNDARVSILTVGAIHAAVGDDISNEFDGESFTTLNIADGSIVSHIPARLLVPSRRGSRNVFADLNVRRIDSIKFVVGINDVFFAIGDTVATMSFDSSEVTLVATYQKSLVLIAAHPDDKRFDYWLVDVSAGVPQRSLLARSTSRNVLIRDSVAADFTMRIADSVVEAFPSVKAYPTDAAFRNPRWRLTRAQLDSMKLGELDVEADPDTRKAGIVVYRDGVQLLGDESMCLVSADGACRWTYPWFTDSRSVRLGMTRRGRRFVYSIGGYTGIAAVGCPPVTPKVYDIDYGDTQLVFAKRNAAFVVVDKYKGQVYGFPSE